MVTPSLRMPASYSAGALPPVEIYTAMAFTPKGSVIIIDESSAALSSRLGHSVAVTTMSEINVNIRKQASVVFYVSAQDWMIAPSIRRDCKEVWMPVSKVTLEVEDDQDMAPGPKDPANDYRNFRLARHVWDDFPYKKGNLIKGSDPALRDRKASTIWMLTWAGRVKHRGMLDCQPWTIAGPARTSV